MPEEVNLVCKRKIQLLSAFGQKTGGLGKIALRYATLEITEAGSPGGDSARQAYEHARSEAAEARHWYVRHRMEHGC